MKTPIFASVALAACAAFTYQGVGAAQPMSDAQARYQQERANCLSGNTQEDRATCLKARELPRAVKHLRDIYRVPCPKTALPIKGVIPPRREPSG